MLDPRLLRTFVAIVDAASFTIAADRLHSTQSTVSQHLGRLEAAVGQPLIDRSARPIAPTAAGERLLGYARRLLALLDEAQTVLADRAGTATIRIGVPDDIVTAAMSRAFADFARRHRDTRLDVTTGLSRDLKKRFRAGEFDIAIVKEAVADGDARAAVPEPLGWFEALDTRGEWPDPIPLVTFPPGGLYRDLMIDRIERARRRWYIAFTGNSLGSVLSAIEAGGSTLRDFAAPDGELGYFSKQFLVYGREGADCACGAPVRRRTEAGRSTFWCARCQRG